MTRMYRAPTAVALILASGALTAAPEVDLTGVDTSAWPLMEAGTAPVLAGLTHLPGRPEGRAYGFDAGTTPGQAAFRLGALMANLQVAANAGEVQATTEAARALVEGLVSLEAPDALVTSATNLVVALSNGAGPDAVAALAAPLLGPQLQAFLGAGEGALHYSLGQWAETLRLVLAAPAAGQGQSLGLARLAGGFSARLEAAGEVAPGVAAALATLGQVAGEDAPGPRQLDEARRAVDTLIAVAG